MSKHLFGIILTPHGIAANNRGETEGNITTLQKVLWHGEQHTTVSAESIRWAIRWWWQQKSVNLNRTWEESGNKPGNHWNAPDFSGWLEDAKNGNRYVDDDVLGFMSAEAAKAEGNDFERPIRLDDTHEIFFHVTPDPNTDETEPLPDRVYKLADDDPMTVDGNTLRFDFYAVAIPKSAKGNQRQKEFLNEAEKSILEKFSGNDTSNKDDSWPKWSEILKAKTKNKTALRKALDDFIKPSKGKTVIRRARLEVARAVSVTPWHGELTFNAASIGATPSASRAGDNPVPYGTEVHATRYQYGFALTPESLNDRKRVADVVDAIVALGNVGGNHARFLFDFSPETVVFRWTDDCAPRMLYGFGLDDDGMPNIRDVIRKVEAKDICPDELCIGGVLSEESKQALEKAGVKNVFPGVRVAADKIKSAINESVKAG